MTAVNDAPVATMTSEALTEDDTLTSITVLDDDTDVDGDSLTVSAISYSGTTAAINADNARIDYTPAANFNTDTITYTVSDGNGGTDTGTLTITVAAVNDAPVTVNDTASTNDNATLSGILLLDDDSDVDGDTLTLTGITNPTNGSHWSETQ